MDLLFHGPPCTPPLCFVQPADQLVQPADQPGQKATPAVCENETMHDRDFSEEDEDGVGAEKGKLDAWGKEHQIASRSPILQHNFTALEQGGHITEVEEQEELIRQCKVRSQDCIFCPPDRVLTLFAVTAGAMREYLQIASPKRLVRNDKALLRCVRRAKITLPVDTQHLATSSALITSDSAT